MELNNKLDHLNQNMCKKQRLIPFICLFLLPNSLIFGNQKQIDVSPQIIDLGETVIIRINRTVDIHAQRILILSPSGKAYSPVPEKKSGYYEISFSETYDRGFLNDNWNQYKVSLLDRYNEVIESTYFYIKQTRKELFFTVYVDDIGGGGYLDEAGEKWFKGLGGKINYGYENDEWAPASLESVVRRYNDPGDSLFYHFHPLEYSKEKIFLKVNRLLRWKQKKESINRLLKIDFRDRHYILFILLFSVLSVGFLIYKRKKASYLLCLICFILTMMLFLAIYSSQMVLNQGHWNVKYSDTEWCRKFLLEARREFEKNQLLFPQIVRYGFNIPPKGLTKFYLAQMGVMADASFIFPDGVEPRLGEIHQSEKGPNIYENDNREILKQLGQYAYRWPSSMLLPLPYYTAIAGELNEPHDGEEINRGILEMPLTFENICENNANKINYGIIDGLPNGALVSTYLHPRDDLRYLKDVIMYIQNNHKLTFISASDYLKIYLSYYPRPVLIDSKQKKAFWAYLDGDRLIPISESDSFIVKNDGLMPRIANLPPYIGLTADTQLLGEIEGKYALVAKNEEHVVLYKLKS